ncbi:amidase [Parapusillimonas granuli]|uniref:Amidase n=1 Tax=Parapusillimonas granuli TaxID=380911 RepID=A0A853FWK2_9BURK|nr:amidase family protein [Parapusillimonas granuli]MBB5213974.1 amidase [Parapusillimonas granuli]NYT50395.1 amidase [Parapusillimonas granuli]
MGKNLAFSRRCGWAAGLFVLAATPVLAAAAMPSERILDMGLAELRIALDRGAITSVELVGAYLERIATIDQPAGGVHAVLAVNGKALEQAKAWDVSRAQQAPGQPSQALAGIPFLAKDNFDAVGLANTGGSLALAQSMPSTNAFVVQKLLDQGAILLGKTNLSELAASYGWYGYSAVGGQTLNPYNPLRTADGSSSGSAAAVAARLAPFALGTDTTGSIRSPASVTGTVGMRATMGLVSRSGVIPMSLTADVVGAITRTVEDQAIVLDAIKGEDERDASTQGIAHLEKPIASGLAGSTLAGKVIAVVDNFDGANPEVDAVKQSAIAAMQEAGARVVNIRLPKVFETLQPDVLGPIGVAEFKPQFETYLAGLSGGQPRDLREFMARLDKLTATGTRAINPGRYKGLIENLETRTTDSPEYIRLLSVVIPSIKREITSLMEAGGYDALFYPTIGCTAPVVPGKTDPTFVCKAYAYAAAKIASTTGFPEVTVNGGLVAGNLPVGVSFLGKAGDDAKVLQLAAAFERAHPALVRR